MDTSAFKLAFFSTQKYDIELFSAKCPKHIEITFFSESLNPNTASLVAGFDGVCCFVNDELNEEVLNILKQYGINLITLRCAGFNNLDLATAKRLNIDVTRVPAYSPEAVAEHCLALILTLNRKTHKAYNRVKENNFDLNGLLGFNLHGKTIGVIGAGKIGSAFLQLMSGFGCTLLYHDPYQTCQYGEAAPLEEVYQQADIIALHCPLTEQTHHLINRQAIEKMKHQVMLVNTSRGALVDTKACIEGLKSRKIGHLALDVYEQESELFFKDLSSTIIDDDIFQRLLTFPNVLITGHQGFFTQEALEQITLTTLLNIEQKRQNNALTNRIT